MTVAVPAPVLPWKVTEQLPAANVQLAALKTPPVVPADNVKATEPVAVREARIAILFGVQTTAVELERAVTVIVAAGLAGLAL